MTRIISGILRGLTLKTPEGEHTRPTKSAVREAVFNRLALEVEGATFYDLYSGGGSIGLEAASWGASQVYFADNNIKAFAVLQQNIGRVIQNFEKNKVQAPPLKAFKGDVSEFLNSSNERFDLAFFDPPYQNTVTELKLNITAICRRANNDATLVIERRKGSESADNVAEIMHSSSWKIQKSKDYGIVSLDYYLNSPVKD